MLGAGESPLGKSRDWEKVAVVVCRQSSWLGSSWSDHIKEKDEKVYLSKVAHWRRYAVGLVVLPFPGEVEAGYVIVVE